MLLPLASFVAAAVISSPATIETQALELAGAPAATPITCTVDVPQGENGWAQWSPSTWIELQPAVCDGLAWLGGDRGRLERAQPFTFWNGQAGVSALVLLHESTHISGDHDETDTECRALALLPGFLSRWLQGDELAAALRVARSYDSQLPALYHERGCA